MTAWNFSRVWRLSRAWRALFGAVALSACAVLPASNGFASPEQDAQVKQLWAECEARDADTAIEGCTKIVAQNLENKEDAARAYHARGKAYKTRGNYNAAIEDFGQAIGLSPGFADAYVQRGVVLLQRQCGYSPCTGRL